MLRERINNAVVGVSGGGLVPADYRQFPVALGLDTYRYGCFGAISGPAEEYTCVETLRYQQNVTNCVEMSLNITDNTYSATVWMLNANGRPDNRKHFPKNSGAKYSAPVQNPGATPVHEQDYTGNIANADNARLAEKSRE